MIGGGIFRRIRNFLARKMALMIKGVKYEIERDTLPAFANVPKNLRIDSPRRIGSSARISMGDDVLFATNVNITDGLHGYQNVVVPYKYQQIEQTKPIRIKRGC